MRKRGVCGLRNSARGVGGGGGGSVIIYVLKILFFHFPSISDALTAVSNRVQFSLQITTISTYCR